jgi:hypothetical protein
MQLASSSSTCTVAGRGTLTLESRATGSTLVCRDALHAPARRKLICIGKAMRSGVYWHFNSKTGGYISVADAGYWGDMR